LNGRNIQVLLIFASLVASCSPAQADPTPEANLPNPASVFCEQNGGMVEIRTGTDGGQYGVCTFPDGSECDEWAFFRGECSAGGPATPASTAAAPGTEVHPDTLPTATPSHTAEDYEGWWTYTHPAHGFSMLLPPDWVVEEITTGDPLLNSHLLNLHPQDSGATLNIRLSFRRGGEDALLWPTGVGAGEFVEDGILDIAGGPARRMLFICPTGQVNDIWYQGAKEPQIRIADLEFGFIYGYTGVYCQEGFSLDGKIRRLGEKIIASLQVP
jgi:putative hemolysin